jgi:hypothetical protein
MGSTASKDASQTSILNDFVTNVCINVTNEYKRVVDTSQSISIKCDPEVREACDDAKYKDSIRHTEMMDRLLAAVTARSDLTPEMLTIATNASTADYVSPIHCCEAKGIKQDIVLDITVSDQTNNKIANDIKSQLTNSLSALKTQSNSGALLAEQTATNDALTNITNKVTNNFPIDVVSKTLNSFNFKQNLTAVNAELSDVSQSTVATILASSIIDTMTNNDADLASDIKTVLDSANKNSGALDNVQGVVDNAVNAAAGVANNAISTAGTVADTGITTAGSVANSFLSATTMIMIAGIIVFAFIAYLFIRNGGLSMVGKLFGIGGPDSPQPTQPMSPMPPMYGPLPQEASPPMQGFNEMPPMYGPQQEPYPQIEPMYGPQPQDAYQPMQPMYDSQSQDSQPMQYPEMQNQYGTFQ